MGEADRRVSQIFGWFELHDGRRAREVVAIYGDGESRREIEVAVDERYVPRYTEIGPPEDGR